MTQKSTATTNRTRPAGPADPSAHHLQCMEIIGGNQAVENAISSPGLDVWVSSHPLHGQVGGDIHYFSMCGSGRVTRLALADVSGHGPTIDHIAQWLRKLMRKHINLLDQTRFARQVNEEFTHFVNADYFATVLLMTYFAPTDHLLICNAGHPRPIWYSQRARTWRPLDPDLPDMGPSILESPGRYAMVPLSNLPLGIIEPTDYRQFSVKLDKGDLVLIYTDGLIEASNPQEELLGETGLLHLIEQLEPSEPQELARNLLAKVNDYTGDATVEDDQTLIVLHHNASDPPALTVGGVMRSLVKMLGLSPV